MLKYPQIYTGIIAIVLQSQAEYFNGNETAKYQNSIIKCDNNTDCIVDCNEDYSCKNATINCPSDPSQSCTVLCPINVQESCDYVNINWNPLAYNSLSCHHRSCHQTPYPPPINDNTPYTIICDHVYGCRGTVIKCPKHAPCNIHCTNLGSCAEAYIYCPDTADCNLHCTGSLACANAIIYWPSDLNLANFTCPDGGQQCNLIQKPKIINSNTTDIWNNVTRVFDCKDEKQCASSTINCPTEGYCLVNCSSSIGACTSSIINCPLYGDCHIICNDIQSA